MDNDKFLLAEAIDFQDNTRIELHLSQPDFKSKTNLPPLVRIQQGARVMYLNNSLMQHGICNGTVGIVTDLDTNQPAVQIAFCVQGAIVHRWITRQTVYFYSNGQRASRTQFPIQNSFALTTHKTQSLTLPYTSLSLDSEFFASGQAYTALSRSPSWNQIETALSKDAFIVDPDVIKEYQRLEQIASQPLPIT